MTHELKFRYVYGILGKHETYFFRYFTIEEIENGSSIIPLYDEESDDNRQVFQIISRDQFTRLKDKNGKEIYKNDKAGPGDEEMYKVDFFNGEFIVEDIETGFVCSLSLHNQDFEIIGNIYRVKI